MTNVSPLRAIADVHGEPAMLQAAADGANTVILLGDLVDGGPDSPGVLRLALDWIELGRARLVRSNHDDKLHRALLGRKVKPAHSLRETLSALEAAPDAGALKERFQRAYAKAPAVIRHGAYLMAHGAVDPRWFDARGRFVDLPEREIGDRMALYGEVDGSTDAYGKPVRRYGWVDALPAHYVAIVGHDRRGGHDWPLTQVGKSGGRAIFLDTGCGKGGPLSYIDLPAEMIAQVPAQ